MPINKTDIIKVAPSLLSADFSKLADEVAKVEDGGCDLLHVDVMDGHFVPNITIGPFIVEAIRNVTKLPLDVHLMIENPWNYVPQFADAGANHITVHVEACGERLSEVLQMIQKKGCTRGASLKPKTELNALQNHLNEIDMVLMMTVNPGFGGQKFIMDVMPKIKELRAQYDGDIEVDGGINEETAPIAVHHGANVLVAGTAIFKSEHPDKIIETFHNISKEEA